MTRAGTRTFASSQSTRGPAKRKTDAVRWSANRARRNLPNAPESHPGAHEQARQESNGDPVLIDIKKGATQVLAENTQNYVRYVADRDAKLRLAAKMNSDGTEELLTPEKTGEWKSYATIPAEDVENTRPMFYEQNNRTLYFLDSRGRDTSALVAVDLAGKSRVVFEDTKSDVEGLIVHPKQNRLQAVSLAQR